MIFAGGWRISKTRLISGFFKGWEGILSPGGTCGYRLGPILSWGIPLCGWTLVVPEGGWALRVPDGGWTLVLPEDG